METKLFSEENKQWEKEHLAGFELDVELFEQLGLKIVQIVPDRSSYRLETDRGFFTLKKLRFPMEEMSFALDCVNCLKGKGFNNIMDIMDRDGSNYYLEYKEEYYYLTQWVDGRECDYLNRHDIVKGSELLAQFHKAAMGFKPARIPSSRNLLGKWPDFFKAQLGEMYGIKHMAESKTSKGPVDEYFIRYTGKCIGDAEKALKLLHKSRYHSAVAKAGREGGFIHHDLLHNSMVYTFEGNVHFTDFELFAVDLRVHDLGSLLLRCMKRGEWDLEAALAIMESYGRIYPLEEYELDIMVPFVLFPQEFRQQARQYLAPDKDVEELEYLEKLDPESESSKKRSSFILQLREML